VPDEATLNALAETLAKTVGVKIEFTPEFMGQGPRRHMMFAELGGLRIELLWAGA
jgi:lactoylglutathione lyase